jgi:hypothetical protein
MSGRIASLVLVGMLAGAGAAQAQDGVGPGTVEVTYIPAGVGYFTAKGDSPSFGNYGFGTAGTYNVNRFIGIEGELVAMISTTSSLQFGDLSSNLKAPNVLGYTGNVVYTPWKKSSFYPYAAGGVGGLTMFERPLVGVNRDQTFLMGNVGGGVKWYAPNNRWGLRGDYRFVANRSKNDAPAFFGDDTRYVHRLYSGVIINTVR